jgi:hypothetical protein
MDRRKVRFVSELHEHLVKTKRTFGFRTGRTRTDPIEGLWEKILFINQPTRGNFEGFFVIRYRWMQKDKNGIYGNSYSDNAVLGIAATRFNAELAIRSYLHRHRTHLFRGWKPVAKWGKQIWPVVSYLVTEVSFSQISCYMRPKQIYLWTGICSHCGKPAKGYIFTENPTWEVVIGKHFCINGKHHWIP